MKGYVLSFSAILLLSSMLLFSMFYSENINSRNLSVNEIKKYSKLEFIKDDLGFDANKITGTSIQVNRGDELEITFNEVIPSNIDKMQRITRFKEFIEKSYSAINNSSVELNIRRMNTQRPGKIPIKFSNKLNYDYVFGSGGDYVLFYADGIDTNINSMDLNLNVIGSSVEVTKPVFASVPNINVNFNYIDQNALNEKHEILQLNSAQDNVIKIRFSDNLNDIIEIQIGSFDSTINGIKVWNKTIQQKIIGLGFKPKMDSINPDSSFRAFLDADLIYSQTDLNSNSLLELKQLS